MAANQSTAPARTAGILVAVAVLAAALLLLYAPRDPAGPVPAGPPSPDGPVDEVATPVATGAVEPVNREVAERSDRPRIDPAAPLPDPEFDGRTAQLSGRVTRGGVGVAAEVEFVAGMNRGVVLACDTEGTVAERPLFPGFARIVIRDRGRSLCDRQIVLRDGRPTTFELDLAPGSPLAGTVVDEAGAPVSGAVVECDFVAVQTGLDGGFVLPRNVAGTSDVRVRAEGLARRELSTWTAREQRIVLRPGGGLEITVDPLPHAGDAVVYVVPTTDRPEHHPWNRLSPLAVRPGGRLLTEQLPREDVEIRAFHSFAVGRTATARIRPGATAIARVEWEPLPVVHGVVVASGEPVVGAEVHLVVTDLAEAAKVALRTASAFARELPFEPVPVADQRTTTDAAGEFALGRPALLRARAWIEVRGPSGRAARVELPPGTEPVEIVLDR